MTREEETKKVINETSASAMEKIMLCEIAISLAKIADELEYIEVYGINAKVEKKEW